MTEITLYEAFDGKRFNAEDKCIKYENNIRKKMDKESFLKKLEIPLSDQDEFTLLKLITSRFSLMMDRINFYYIDKDIISKFEKSISAKEKTPMYLYAETVSSPSKHKLYNIGDLKDYMEDAGIDKTMVFINGSCIYTINYIIKEEIYDIISLQNHLYSLMDSKGVSHADFK